MNIAANALHSNAITVPAGVSRPDGGGFAFMRVVEQTSPGLYRISLGGQLMEARSSLDLEPGSFLRVQLRVAAGQLQLVPEAAPDSPLRQIFRFTESAFQNGGLPPQLSQTLASLGLPLDALSGRLFSAMQQLGLRFDGGRLQKAYRIAARFPGREEQAAEVALSLLEKGMEADSDLVASLLAALLGDSGADEGNRRRREKQAGREDGLAGGAMGKNGGFGGLEKVVGELYGCSVAALGDGAAGGGPGLLTLFNHIAAGSRHWIVVPFFMDLDGGADGLADVEQSADGNVLRGNIRVLLDLEGKKTEKVCVSARSPSSEYGFVVYYGRKGVEALDYAPSLPEWQAALERLFPDAAVSSRPIQELGLFCEPGRELAACNLEA